VVVRLGSHNTNPVALIQAAPIELTASQRRAGLDRRGGEGQPGPESSSLQAGPQVAPQLQRSEIRNRHS
jgi:hypothetical protein